MNPTFKVFGILLFGITLSIVVPNILTNNNTKKLENSEPVQVSKAEEKIEDSIALAQTEETPKVVNEEVPVQEETVTPEPENIETVETPEPPVVVTDPIVFDRLTMTELTEKLNRSLKSKLAGTGETFAKYAVEMGIDPYLAVAIVLHETGCNGTCSDLVMNCNNVGGMKGSPGCNGGSYKAFDTLEEGIYSFMNNLKVKYIDQGLVTPEQINTKYASSTAWAGKIHYYMDKIKAA